MNGLTVKQRYDLEELLKAEAKEGDFTTLSNLQSIVTIGLNLRKEWQIVQANKEREAKIRGLKKLKAYSIVYTRLIGEMMGEPLHKIKDGSTRMVISFKGHQWRIPYTSLQIEPLNEMEKNLGRILNNVPL